MKKLVLFFTISLGLIFNPQTSHASYYTDVSYTHWAYEDIYFMTKHKVINGYKNGIFKPGQTITRKDAAIMMVRALEIELDTDITPLKDMVHTSPGYVQVQIALQNNWLSTYDGAFKPYEILTRDEMAKALATAFSYTGYGTSRFKDVEMGHPYYSFIDAILAYEVTTGYTDQTYRPLEKVTRAQFSAFLSRVFQQPTNYVVRENGIDIAESPNLDRAIELAAEFNQATIHPQDNRFLPFSQQLSSSNKSSIQKGVLIYNGLNENESFTTDFYDSYLSYKDEYGNSQPMFDSFIVLGLRYPGGQFAENHLNTANYSDYLWYIERTFKSDGALAKLNEAAAIQNRKVNVYLTIPYPKRSGDIITLNGTVLDNNNYTRSDLARWYVDQVTRYWKASQYSNIDLQGFYWLNETVKVDNDGAILNSLSTYLKRLNYEFVYAPHATSTNFKKWQRYGFDASFLQPNAFRTSVPNKEARLHKAFVNAQIYGSGITLEVNSYGPNQIDEGQEAWNLYMDFAKRYKLTQSSFLFYQDRDMIHRMKTYSYPTYNVWYEDVTSQLFPVIATE